MKRQLLTLGAIALPIVVAAIVVRGFIRDVIVVPLFYAGWTIQQIVSSISQPLIWYGFLLLIVILAARSLLARQPIAYLRHPEGEERGRIEGWVRLLDQAERSSFSRWRLAQRLGQLALEMLGEEEHLTQRQLWRRLENGSLPMPPEIQAYLKARARPARTGNPLLRRRQEATPLDLDPQRVVEYLEATVQRLPGGSA
jgi:hypothetical protein